MGDGNYYVGVDVGTSSVRAGVVDSKGFVIGKSAKNITLWKPRTDFYEQSSEEIWSAIGFTVREALKQANAAPEAIRGISFDATCSL